MIKLTALLLLAAAPPALLARDGGVPGKNGQSLNSGYLICAAYNQARPIYDALDAEAAKPFQKAAELFFKAAQITDGATPEAQLSENVNEAKARMIEQHKSDDAEAAGALSSIAEGCDALEGHALEQVEAAEEEALGNAT